MRLLVHTGVLGKFYRNLIKYSTSTASIPLQNRYARLENFLQTRIRRFLEQNVTTTYRNVENLENKKIARPLRNNAINNLQLYEKNTLEYNELLDKMKTLLVTAQSSVRKEYIRQIDDQCCRLLTTLSAAEILRVLHGLMESGVVIVNLKLYKNSLLMLNKFLEKGHLDINEKLQLLFFQGLGKKKMTGNVKRLITHLPPLKDLSLMEKVVVVDAICKCSIKLKAKDMRSLEEILEKNAAEVVNDPMIFVTICKAISLFGASTNFYTHDLSEEIIKRNRRWPLLQASYILAMYAVANHENSALTERLFRDCISEIAIANKDTCKINIRVKDVNKVVWALSMFNYKLRQEDKIELLGFLFWRYRDFETHPHHLVNCLLALWILDCKMHKLIEAYVENGFFRRIQQQKNRWKSVARLQLLLSCVKIESPETNLPAELFEADKVGLHVPESVKSLYGIVKELRNQLDIDEIMINCPINAIYIAGVSLRTRGKLIHVDLLDERTCFNGTDVPHGLMNLKLRLLHKIGIYSVTIPKQLSKDVEFVRSAILNSAKDSTK